MSEAVEAASGDEVVRWDEYEVVETKDVAIEDVKFVDDVYPRDEVSEAAVSRYKANLDDLPSIELATDNTLVDGYHRLRAHQSEGKETIEADITNLADSTQIYLAAIAANNDHGQQLVTEDKKEAAARLRLDHRMEHGEIAKVLGISKSTATTYSKNANKKLREIRRERVYAWYLDYLTCPSQSDVAERLDEEEGIEADQSTVSNDLMNSAIRGKIHSPSTFDEAVELDDNPDWLRWGNVWAFNSVNKNFGTDWPGRIPGQIIQNLLIHHTDEYDLVVDPMAGGGTTVDVCKAMARRYAAFDLNPLEDKNIRKADTTGGFGDMDSGVADLVFIDPPYHRLKDGEYAEGGISSESVGEWLTSINKLLKESVRVGRSDCTIALLVEAYLDESESGSFQDLPFKCLRIGEDLGLSQIQRISVPMNLAHKSQRSIEQAKENNVLADHNRDLIVWGVP